MRILFVCTGNTCRSPLAERLARQAYPAHHWESAGVAPQGSIHPMSAAVLKEREVDATGFISRYVDDLKLTLFDHIVLIGERAQRQTQVPATGVQVHDWDVADPYNAEGSTEEVMGVYRACAGELEGRIAELVKSFN